MDPPPPPSNLTMTDFLTTNAQTYSNVPFYLTVVETYLDCPVRPSALVRGVHSSCALFRVISRRNSASRQGPLCTTLRLRDVTMLCLPGAVN